MELKVEGLLERGALLDPGFEVERTIDQRLAGFDIPLRVAVVSARPSPQLLIVDSPIDKKLHLVPELLTQLLLEVVREEVFLWH